jgi:hypothetical protein
VTVESASRDDRRFDAFITYASAPDRPCARELERFLEAFHRLSEVRPPLPALQICRDASDLKLSRLPAARVQEAIEHHLALSGRLIVLCSAGAIRSPYVRDEIAWWLAHRETGSILLAVTDGRDPVGEPESVFPPALIAEHLHHRVWFDLRAWNGRTPEGAIGVRDFEDARIALAAEIYDRTAGELQPVWQRELQRQKRRRRVTRAAIAGLSLAVIAAALIALWVQRKRADERVEAAAARRQDTLTALMNSGFERIRSDGPVDALQPFLAAEQLAAAPPARQLPVGSIIDDIVRASPELTQAIPFAGSTLNDLRWDGDTIVVVQSWIGIRRFDAASGQELGAPRAPPGCIVTRGLLATTSTLALVVCQPEQMINPGRVPRPRLTLQGFDLATGRTYPAVQLAGDVHHLQLSADGRIAVVELRARRPSQAQLQFDVISGRATPLDLASDVKRVELSPDGTRVVATLRNRVDDVTRIELYSLQPWARVEAPQITDDHVVFSPSGRMFATWSSAEPQRGVHVWSSTDGAPVGTAVATGARFGDATLEDDGHVVITPDTGGAERFLAATGNGDRRAFLCGRRVDFTLSDPQTKQLICFGDKLFETWGIEHGQRISLPVHLHDDVHHARFDPAGDRVAMLTRDAVLIWRIENTQLAARLRRAQLGDGKVQLACLARDGATVFTSQGSSPSTVRAWGIPDGRVKWSASIDGAVNSLRASRTGKDLLITTTAATGQMRDIATGALRSKLAIAGSQASDPERVAMFSADGAYFFADAEDGWHLGTTARGPTLVATPEDRPSAEQVEISDGGTVAVRTTSAIHLFDARTGSYLGAPEELNSSLAMMFDGEELWAIRGPLSFPRGIVTWWRDRPTQLIPSQDALVTDSTLRGLTPGSPPTWIARDDRSGQVALRVRRPVSFGRLVPGADRDTEARAEVLADGTLVTAVDGALQLWGQSGEPLSPRLTPGGAGVDGIDVVGSPGGRTFMMFSSNEVVVWHEVPPSDDPARALRIGTLIDQMLTPMGWIGVTSLTFRVFWNQLRAKSGDRVAQLASTIYAASASDLDSLLARNPELCHQTLDTAGNTPLHLAVQTTRLDLVQAVLHRCTGPDDRDLAGSTALHIAATAGRAELVRALIAAGANQSLQDALGQTAAEAALSFVLDAEVVEQLGTRAPAERKQAALVQAVALGKLDLVKALIHIGADPRLPWNSWSFVLASLMTPDPDPAITTLLLDAGVDPSVPRGRFDELTGPRWAAVKNRLRPVSMPPFGQLPR